MSENKNETLEFISSIAFCFFAFLILGAILRYFVGFWSSLPTAISVALIGAIATLIHFFLGNSKEKISELVEKERVTLYLEVLELAIKEEEVDGGGDIYKILHERKARFIVFGGERILLLISDRVADGANPLRIEDLAVALRKDMNLKSRRTEESLVAPWVARKADETRKVDS